MQEDNDEITFKYLLPSCRDYTKKDIHLQLNPFSPLSAFFHTVAYSLPPPICRHPF